MPGSADDPFRTPVADLQRRSNRAFYVGIVGALCLFPLCALAVVLALGIRRDCRELGLEIPQRAMAAFVLGLIGGGLWVFALVLRLL